MRKADQSLESPLTLWELACQRWLAVCQSMKMLKGLSPSLASQAPTGFGGVQKVEYSQDTCGSWLASDGGVSVNENAERPVPIAGTPGSHRVWWCSKKSSTAKTPVGAGLPAMAVCQSTKMLKGLSPSLASQAPTGFGGVQKSRVQPRHLWELACQRWRCVCQLQCPGQPKQKNKE